MAVETTGKEDRGRGNIGVSMKTKEALDSIKHYGQSYDGLIQELVGFWKENKEGTPTQERTQKIMNDFGAKMKRPAGTGLFRESNMDGSATTTNCFYCSTSPAGFQEGGLR